nr:MAG TPA: hypothetical protein [Caudoviricetes sp.]
MKSCPAFFIFKFSFRFFLPVMPVGQQICFKFSFTFSETLVFRLVRCRP